MSKTVIVRDLNRSSKFYNKYEWAVRWNQREIQVLRHSLDSFQVEKAIANVRYWEAQRHNRSWSKNTDTFRSEITSGVVNDIHATRALLETMPDAKRMLSFGSITVYVDSAELKDQLVKHGQLYINWGAVRVQRANVIYPADTIVLINPKYKYRTYLRSREVSDENIEILKNWLAAQENQISASPGLKNFMDHRKTRYYYPTNYTADYHYFDHDDMQYVTMLRMVLPVAIRKTVPIIAK